MLYNSTLEVTQSNYQYKGGTSSDLHFNGSINPLKYCVDMVQQIFEVGNNILGGTDISEEVIKQTIPMTLKDLSDETTDKQGYPDFYGVNEYLTSLFNLLKVPNYQLHMQISDFACFLIDYNRSLGQRQE